MTDDVVDIAVARVARATDCEKLSPEELLKFVLHQLNEVGDVAACIVTLIRKPPDTDGEQIMEFRAGLDRSQEIGYLALAQKLRLEDWTDFE